MADTNQSNSNDEGTGGTPNTGGGGDSALNKVINHMSGNKIEAGLWLTRCFTIIASILFFLPIGANPYSMYQKVLLSNAATSALRLHMRLPNFQFSREFFAMMFLEDSAHYLFFSLVFVMGYPVTMSLVPVFLFAVLHATSYSKSLLNQIGPNAGQIIRNLISKIELQQRTILRFIACGEIFLMPMIIFMCFGGYASLLQPFIYYRFLTLRYASRRNPYCRQLFYEMRVATEQLSQNPSCPQMVRNIMYKAIGFITRLAPPVPAQ